MRGAAVFPPRPAVRIGLPLDGWRLAVVSQADGQPVAWGEVGELVSAAPGWHAYLVPEKGAAGFRPALALGCERGYHTGYPFAPIPRA